jgi:peptide methionine sulfoxide reductase MsrA
MRDPPTNASHARGRTSRDASTVRYACSPCEHVQGDGHIEAVRVEYDPEHVSYEQLLGVFFAQRHVRKAKRQYMSAVWYHDGEQRTAAKAAIVTHMLGSIVELHAASEWHDAEEHHQDYNWKQSRR